MTNLPQVPVLDPMLVGYITAVKLIGDPQWYYLFSVVDKDYGDPEIGYLHLFKNEDDAADENAPGFKTSEPFFRARVADPKDEDDPNMTFVLAVPLSSVAAFRYDS